MLFAGSRQTAILADLKKRRGPRPSARKNGDGVPSLAAPAFPPGAASCEPMQNYDIVMLAMLAIAAIFGAVKGLAWQLAALGSLVASYFVALRFSPVVASHVGGPAPWNRFLAMAILYCLCGALIWYAFHLVSRFVDRLKLRDFDRQLGALFGCATAVVVCVVLTFFAVTLSDQSRSAVLASRSGHFIAALLDQADGVMPRELHDFLDPYLRRLEKELKPAGGAPSATTAGVERGSS